MSTRREFLNQAAAASVVAAASVQIAQAGKGTDAGPKPPTKTHKMVPRINSVIRREETTLRLGGFGDNYHMSWAADGRQFVAVCDGVGWSKNPRGMYNSRLFAINGGPRDATFQDVPGYPDLVPRVRNPEVARYYGFGTLALDGRLYQFLSTFNHGGFRSDGSPWPDVRWAGAKLIFSPDNGRTWCNQDGSTPVVWDLPQRRSRENMVFYEEPQGAFSLLTVLQMGRNYESNRDGYVYVYSPNGNTDGTMNQLALLRIPKAQLLNRGAYEYFSGMRPDGNATWVKDINARAVVHTFPRGWVNDTTIHPGENPWGWIPSVAYNAPLGVFMMANWGTGCTSDHSWFGKPSYLGLWSAPHPWGPWTQIHEETAWAPNNDLAARAFAPQISPKWIADDGKSFWLVWTDFQQKGTRSEILQIQEDANRIATHDDEMRWVSQVRRIMPYYAFNTQRIDLVIA